MFHIGWFLPNGFAVQEWPAPEPEHDWTKPALYQEMAVKLEVGGFDLLVIEDTSMVPDTYGGSSEIYLAHALHAPKLDPVPLVPLIAAATQHIGIVPTLVTTYYPPFLLARLMATLDHLTDGRAGWNIVTGVSSLSAQNYGMDALPPHDTRYDMADEFLDVCTKLWASWEHDAVIKDPASGVYSDYTKVHRVDHQGKWFRSRGPLNVHASPQHKPALVQAGASPRGREFAAHHADAILALGRSLEGMKTYRDDVHQRMAKYGRKPSDVKVLYLINPVIGDTEAEAREKHRQASEVTESRLYDALASVSMLTGVDLSRFDVDQPLPPVEVTGESTIFSRFDGMDPKPTIRQMIEIRATQTSGIQLIGTADQIADRMQEAMDYAGGDGFLIGGHFSTGTVETVIDRLVPALRNRGLIREGFAPGTLRDHLQEF